MSKAIGSVGLANPAAVYAKSMGYSYKIVDTPLGQKGIVTLPNGREVDEWELYYQRHRKNDNTPAQRSRGTSADYTKITSPAERNSYLKSTIGKITMPQSKRRVKGSNRY